LWASPPPPLLSARGADIEDDEDEDEDEDDEYEEDEDDEYEEDDDDDDEEEVKRCPATRRTLVPTGRCRLEVRSTCTV
jgi:hypothetical protein